jgi:hypothetical protein
VSSDRSAPAPARSPDTTRADLKSEAIVSHRDLSALFHELAGRLQEVVRFDYLGLVLHEGPSQTMRLHILEGRELGVRDHGPGGPPISPLTTADILYMHLI